MIRAFPLAVLAILALVPAPPLHAQIVRGQVVEEGSRNPVEGAMVLLLEVDGTTVHRVLTDATGGFILDADHPGPHVIRVDRIGYESVTADRFDVPVEGTFRLVTVPIRPVELVGLEVEGARRCEVRGEQGRATARAWEEARKALEAAAWTLEAGVYRYTLLNYQRTLSADRRTVVSEDRRFDRGTGQAPYVSVPATQLAERGFITRNADRTLTYFAPDAAAFLSDAFLDTHCMRLESVKDGQIGLAFQPVRGRDLPEIRGTLWLDAATALLKRLDFTYVNLPRDHDMGDAGGEVTFGRLPNGTWIVRDWHIRMPLLTTNPQRTRVVVQGYFVQGGTVWRVNDREGTTVVESATASVSGIVMDSTGTHPLEGATIRGQGEAEVAVTQGTGTFLVSGLAPGLQTIEVRHPSLDSLQLGPSFFDVEVAAGEVAGTRFRIPGVGEVLADACAGAPDQDRETAVVFGRVRREDAPAMGAPVRVRWLGDDRRGFDITARAAPGGAGSVDMRWTAEPDDARWLATTLDPRGIFMVCGVPTRSQLRIEAGDDADREVTTVTIPTGMPVVLVALTLRPTREP
jgi:hypothetical protein